MSSAGSRLQAQAVRHCLAGCDAEDAVQQACMEFLRYYDGPSGPDALRYLMVAVKRCAWALGESAERRHGSEIEVTRTDAITEDGCRTAALCGRPGPLQRAQIREEYLAVAAGLAELKPDERAAVSLLASGFSYRDICASKGWTKTKVNRCLAEGRASLRARIAGSRVLQRPS